MPPVTPTQINGQRSLTARVLSCAYPDGFDFLAAKLDNALHARTPDVVSRDIQESAQKK